MKKSWKVLNRWSRHFFERRKTTVVPLSTEFTDGLRNGARYEIQLRNGRKVIAYYWSDGSQFTYHVARSDQKAWYRREIPSSKVKDVCGRVIEQL